MNALGKTLVVFVAAASIGFAAFAMSLVSGGPNWKGESESAELTNDFVFSLAGGEKPIYSLKARTTGAAVGGSTPLLAEAVSNARKQQLADAKKQQAFLEGEIKNIRPSITENQSLILVDESGVRARSEAYIQQLDQLQLAIQVASAEFNSKAVDILQIRRLGVERREEGFRLKNQLELLRNDLFASEQQRKALEDELVRSEENLKRLQRRERQLEQQIGVSTDVGTLQTEAQK